uniref:Protein quaking n=1 Tax=Mesocestoides corti TaxID=53468 RepID=A0A5K3EIE4_MESCO
MELAVLNGSFHYFVCFVCLTPNPFVAVAVLYAFCSQSVSPHPTLIHTLG